MVYLIPFLNAFILYICLTSGQALNKPYAWFVENLVVRLPSWAGKVLGGCVLCTSFWMGVTELIVKLLVYIAPDYDLLLTLDVLNSVTLLAYNAVTTTLLYKLLKL